MSNPIRRSGFSISRDTSPGIKMVVGFYDHPHSLKGSFSVKLYV